MSTSAKVTITEQDRSSIVPVTEGVYTGIVIASEKGPVNTPTLITSNNDFLNKFGNPNPKLGVSMYSALNYFNQGDKLWVVRASHNDSKYAAALVRSKVESIPTEFGVDLPRNCLIVNPIDNGLTQEELDSYQFPTYRTNKEYELTDLNLASSVNRSNTISVISSTGDLSLEVGDQISITDKSLEELNSSEDDVGENENTYTISQINQISQRYDKITVSSPVTVVAGQSVKKYNVETESLEEYEGSPVVVKDGTSTTEVLVTNSDYIARGDTLVFNDNTEVKVVFQSKENYSETELQLTLDSEITATVDQSIYRVTQSEFEDRDCFLVASLNQGRWGSLISIAITPSLNYDNAFNIIVYYNGVQVENWEVTRENELDGFGNQLEMEQKINGNSSYIQVISNGNNLDKPLNTDYSLWIQNPRDIFVSSGAILSENLLQGHIEVKVSDTSKFKMGSRIKFVLDEATSNTDPLQEVDGVELSLEYKVTAINQLTRALTLDRAIEEEEIDSVWYNSEGEAVNTLVYVFDETNNDSENGIIDGVQYYKIRQLPNIYYNYSLNSPFIVDGINGTLLSGGANLLTGGFNGSAVTIGDLITAANTLSNSEATPCQLLMDGGWTYPEFAQTLLNIANTQGVTHVYLSVPSTAEDSNDPVSAVTEYRNSLNINDSHASLFTGWIKYFDEYNQVYVWVSPESYAVCSQSMVTSNYAMFYPAAGWTRGAVNGLDVKVKYNESQRDVLIENQINPIRKKDGVGLAIWGNDTLLSKPSPLQLRSVAMLLIVIKQGLLENLEYTTFDFNNEETWTRCEGTIDAFMRDEIKAKGGVYNYQVAISDVITQTDIDNRRMPVFLGIQPTMDINLIPVTLAIYNSSVDIEVSL